MWHFIYNALLFMALPFVPIKLLWRGIKQPAYLKHWGERFGKYSIDVNKQAIIWIHCVSVGETRAAEPLIKQFKLLYPKHQILLTHGTPTGRETSVQLFGNTVWRAYLPYDLPFAVKGFLSHFKPEIGILMETELWFNLIDGCDKNDIPLMLLNARLSKKSSDRYAKLGHFITQHLNTLALIGAQSIDDEMRFKSLGANNTTLIGNFKFDVTAPPAQLAAGDALKKLLSTTNKLVFVAASTRSGEEELILEAIQHLHLNMLTIIVPRHPERFDEVEVLLNTRHFKYQLKTEIHESLNKDVEVILGNTMGELFTYYAACDFAFVGGSLKKYGGQNMIEPASLGKPVLMGKYTYNFEEASKNAVKLGAATQIKSIEDFKLKLQALCTQPHLRKKMGQAAITFSQSHTGATQRVMREIARILPSTHSQ